MTKLTDRDRPMAEILATLLRLHPADRLDVFAGAIRAALDSGVLDAPGVPGAFGDTWCSATCKRLAEAASPLAVEPVSSTPEGGAGGE